MTSTQRGTADFQWLFDILVVLAFFLAVVVGIPICLLVWGGVKVWGWVKPGQEQIK